MIAAVGVSQKFQPQSVDPGQGNFDAPVRPFSSSGRELVLTLQPQGGAEDDSLIRMNTPRALYSQRSSIVSAYRDLVAGAIIVTGAGGLRAEEHASKIRSRSKMALLLRFL